MSEHIFSPENIEVNNPINIDVPHGSIVTVGNIFFMEDEISRIEVEKIEQFQDTIFFDLYTGNRRICHVVAKGTYILDIDTIAKRYYDLRPVDKFDKEEGE